MSITRVKPEVCSVVFVDGIAVSLTSGLEFDTNDQVVKEHPWAFEEDADAVRAPKQRRTSVEVATAVPGEKRNR